MRRPLAMHDFAIAGLEPRKNEKKGLTVAGHKCGQEALPHGQEVRKLRP
jgi:hypothetical protein